MKRLPFSPQMMAAWLAGRKKVTRRAMNPQPEFLEPVPQEFENGHYGGYVVDDKSVGHRPTYFPGETVAISEHTHIGGNGKAHYLVDGAPVEGFNWVSPVTGKPYQQIVLPPRYMPGEWSRSQARIKRVFAEPLGILTPEEIIREGLQTRLRGHDAVRDLLEQWDRLWFLLHGRKPDPTEWVWRHELEPAP